MLLIEKLNSVMWAFTQTRVVNLAIEHGIFELLKDGFFQIEDIAKKLNLDVKATRKVIKALVALGLLVSGENGYSLIPELKERWNGEIGYKYYLEHAIHLYNRWNNELDSWLKGENKAIQRKERLRDPEMTKKFALAMKSLSWDIIQLLLDKIKLTPKAKILDIGGGLGHYSIAFLKKEPETKAVVVDTPLTVELALKEIEKESDNIKQRIKFIADDYFNLNYKEEFDLVLLANILHQESEENNKKLINIAFNSLKEGGKILIIDFVIDEAKEKELMGVMFAINMMDWGDTYSFGEISNWLSQAGFKYITLHYLSQTRWMITGIKGSTKGFY